MTGAALTSTAARFHLSLVGAVSLIVIGLAGSWSRRARVLRPVGVARGVEPLGEQRLAGAQGAGDGPVVVVPDAERDGPRPGGRQGDRRRAVPRATGAGGAEPGGVLERDDAQVDVLVLRRGGRDGDVGELGRRGRRPDLGVAELRVGPLDEGPGQPGARDRRGLTRRRRRRRRPSRGAAHRRPTSRMRRVVALPLPVAWTCWSIRMLPTLVGVETLTTGAVPVR